MHVPMRFSARSAPNMQEHFKEQCAGDTNLKASAQTHNCFRDVHQVSPHAHFVLDCMSAELLTMSDVPSPA